MQQIESRDLFRSASLLCLGAKLNRIEREGKAVTFVLEDEKLEQLDMNYRTGQALINPLQLKEILNLLKDKIFRGYHGTLR